MNKQLLKLSALCLLIVASSCKKTVKAPEEQPKNEVAINGATYPTVVIGNQTWTTVNYNGTGGVNYNDGANDLTVGKLYSFQEVKAIGDLPTGWRLPSEADVKKLMATVGTKLDGTDIYTDATASQKLMSTTSWTNSGLKGSNSTGLNLQPTGFLFVRTNGDKIYSDKGVLASFWSSTSTATSSPMMFEISTNSYDSNDQPAGLRGAIYNTTASGDGTTTLPAEKRSIRFVKDN